MASASPRTVAFSQSMRFRPHENPEARGSRFPGGDGSGTKGPSPKPHGLSVGGRASRTPGLLTSRLGGCRSPSLGASLSLLFGQSAVQCHVSGTAGTWTSATTQLIPSPGRHDSSITALSPLSLTVISESFSTQCSRETLPIDQNWREEIYLPASGVRYSCILLALFPERT